MKLYILVRTDLDVSIGKLMVHAGHVCTRITNGWAGWGFLNTWVCEDCHTIIILQAKDLEDLKTYYNKWKEGYPNRPAVMIEDAGFYEVPKGTIIMCGIGPISKEEAKELGLNKLSLYKK